MAAPPSSSSHADDILYHDPFHGGLVFMRPSSYSQDLMRIEDVPHEQHRFISPSPATRLPSPIRSHYRTPPPHANYSTSSNQCERIYSLFCSSMQYDGPEGVYYANSTIRRAEPKGIVEEQFEEHDSNTGKHTMRILRGLRDKGHSITYEQDIASGQIQEHETLHNLEKDEVAKFDRKWKSRAERSFPDQDRHFRREAIAFIPMYL